MTFQGAILSVGELIERAKAAPAPVADPSSPLRMLHTAATNAADVAALMLRGDSLDDAWRFGVLQTIDDYNSNMRRGGTTHARHVFDDEPAPTGSAQIDAAFAALADYLAQRDGWQVPDWAGKPWRVTSDWYPVVISWGRDEARRTSPRAFRRRGIYITPLGLARA
ncbi:hypothetical protein [Actinomyces trachealis]|uniref:hypothetical protein n=1 Tax=Actinomyces trachealis TaxID=2763540 RepID=UPI0018C62714|nr:hypothetical protein [Actinomyces trachealis]